MGSDPDVEWSAVDAGFEINKHTMRAPDVSVAPPPLTEENSGWAPGVPPLAVEYADKGQNEAELQIKIKQLLAAGTRYIRVVRLIGPQRIEMYTKDGQPKRILSATDHLEAPGVLRNPIPVHALFDRKAAYCVTLKNLLQREGYEDLNAVLQKGIEKGIVKGKEEGKKESKREGKAQGKIEGGLNAHKALFHVLAARGIQVDAQTSAHVRSCRDQAQIDTWITRAALANSLEDVF
uniref:Restriction endonuclease n=1 Tax=Candidatus Kentrum sp. MB TaxID=2138164 RepID=A0A450XDX7_9GAMM|nr:MAG: Putative restriction endonuclease [Candidatus Kentron sp. MB]VFK74331.1 MAG: Putative restriction endonuclease [Candidatus Kentron sp. MB]